MSVEIEKILKQYAGTECIKIPRTQLLNELYCAMGYSGRGTSLPTVDGKNNLAIYLLYRHKNCDPNDPIKSVLRAALQEIFNISNEQVHAELKLLQNIPDVYITDDYSSYAAKLDEMIALKIFNIVGRMGIVKIALLEAESKIESKLKHFLDKSGKNSTLRALLLEVRQLGLSLNAIGAKHTDSERNARAIDHALKKLLQHKVGVTEVEPLRYAAKLLDNYNYYQKDHDTTQLLSKIYRGSISVEAESYKGFSKHPAA